MNTKCFFGFHKWKVIPCPVEGVVPKIVWVDMPETFKTNGETIYTIHRICKCCGKRQW